jgi:ABC-type sugar transport system ATPase subunit
VLQDGLVEQVGSPRELYERPGNLFVARFIGSPRMNVLPLALVQGLGPVPAGAETVGVRPEHMRVVEPGAGLLRGKLVFGEYTGASSLLHVELADGEMCLVLHEGAVPADDTEVGLAAEGHNLHFFDAAGRARRPQD